MTSTKRDFVSRCRSVHLPRNLPVIKKRRGKNKQTKKPHKISLRTEAGAPQGGPCYPIISRRRQNKTSTIRFFHKVFTFFGNMQAKNVDLP